MKKIHPHSEEKQNENVVPFFTIIHRAKGKDPFNQASSHKRHLDTISLNYTRTYHFPGNSTFTCAKS